MPELRAWDEREAVAFAPHLERALTGRKVMPEIPDQEIPTLATFVNSSE